MESPGDYLKREREHRGVSLQKIFEATRVPMKYLEAIEADRIEGMPHPTFVKGYIRSYCKVLGVDENDAVLRFEVWYADKTAEVVDAGRPRPIHEIRKAKAAPLPGRELKAPVWLGKAIIILGGIIVVIVAYTLTRRDLSAPEPRALAPSGIQTSAEPAPSTEAALPEPTQPLSEYVPPAPMAAQAPPAPAPPVAQAPAASPAAPQAPAVPAPAPKQAPAKAAQAVEPKKPEATTVQAEPAGQEADAEAGRHTLTANAREMVWIKISIDKAAPVEVLLKAGEKVTWTAAEDIVVVIGNAGGVGLTYNGKAISGLGGQGEVVDLRLPSGKSYKVKKPQPQEKPMPRSPDAPQLAPAINMPEVPAAKPGPEPAE